MQVKVFRCDYHTINEEDYTELLKGITDWEEVSEEDIAILQKSSYVVVRRYTQPEIEATVADLVKELKARELKQAQVLKKYKEDEALRKQKALERKLEKAKKLLEQHGN